MPLPPPDPEEHVLPELDLGDIWAYLNPHMLYAKHLGLRGSYRKLKEAGDPKLAELEKVIAKVQDAGWIRARAMYRYFPARSEGNTLSRRASRAEARRASRSPGRSRASVCASPTSSIPERAAALGTRSPS